MSSSYRALLARPNAGLVALACALGWLSFGGYTLAIVLAVRAATGSFAEAGAAVAAFTAASGTLAPARGRLVDHTGGSALLGLALVHAGALAFLMVASAASCGGAVLTVACGVAGTCAPPLIASTRAAWRRVAGPELAATAHALNAALGDAGGVAGPALTGVVAGLVSPAAALAVLVPGPAVGAALVVAATGIGRLSTPRPAAGRRWSVLRESAGLRTVVLGELLLGLWLGAVDVAVPALAAADGAAALASLPLALFAAGSVVVSLRVGAGRRSRPPEWRYVLGSLLLAGVVPIVLLVPSLAGIAAVLAAAGASFGLLNAAVFEVLDHVAAQSRAVEAFTWLTTAQGAGAAAGAAAAGQLASVSTRSMLLLVALPPALGAAVTVARRSTLRTRAAPEAS